MAQNVGALDRYARLFIGLTLLSFAFGNGLKIEGWHWLGLFGFVFLVTALLQSCPAYSLLGTSTRDRSATQRIHPDIGSEMDDRHA